MHMKMNTDEKAGQTRLLIRTPNWQGKLAYSSAISACMQSSLIGHLRISAGTLSVSKSP